MATNTEKIVVQVVVQGDKQLDNLTKKSGTATKSFGKMAAGIATATIAFRTISSVIGNAVKTFKDFEFQMAKVKAITGASNKDFKILTKTAQDLGRSTFFTATQVAKLQTNYGKLGFTTKEILKAQEATLLLATATDTDLARAAIVAGAAVRGFGLDANQTGRVADVMAKAFTSSALDIEKFQTSMTKVAPIAAGANISLEATTAVMGTLTDAGIEASIAGTSLRNIFLKMQDPASDLSKHLGFTVKSSDDLERALQQLNSEGLSNAEMMKLVDLRQVAAFQTMVNGSERISHLTDQFNLANGSAKEMAEIVGDTLEGSFKRFQSASEGLQIAIMGGKKGGFIAHFTGQLAKMMNVITDSISPQQTQLEVLQETTQAMDDQFSLLTQGNLSQEARVQVIQDLNTEYGDYLPNLVSEKDDLEDIRDMQIQVNNLMMERIVAMAMEEELAELAKAQSKAIKGQVNSNIALAESERDLGKQNENTIQSYNAYKDAVLGIIPVNKSVIDNAEEDKEKLIKGYEETAKQLGLSFKNIMASLAAARKKKKDVDKDLGTGGDNSIINETKDRNEALLDLQLEYATLLQDQEGMSLEEREINMINLENRFNKEKLQVQLDYLQARIDNTITSEEERVAFRQQMSALELTEEQRIQNVKLGYIQQEKDANIGLQNAKAAALRGYLDIAAGFAQEGSALAKGIFLLQQAAAVKEVLVGQFAANAAIMQTGYAGFMLSGGTSLIAAQGLVAANNITSGLSIAGILAQTVMGLDKKARGGMIEEFANGGLVQGKSHAQGGEKFAVGGRVVELEGGEAVINKRSTSMFSSQLSAMNAAGGGVKFADGGLLNQPSFSQQQFNALGQNQMMGAMGNSGKVTVVEADITSSQNTVSVIQSQATI
jgi:TP901 family phage tail tape measure protein